MEKNNVESSKKTTKKVSTKKATNSNKKSGDMTSRKRVFAVLIAVIFVLAVVLIVIPLVKKTGDKAEAAGKIAEEKSFETYKLKDTKISYEDDTTVFETKIENIGSETIPAGGFNIILLDKEGAELTSIGVYLKEMEPAEIIETKAVIAEKIENIYDMKIVSDESVPDDTEQVPEDAPVEEVPEETVEQ